MSLPARVVEHLNQSLHDLLSRDDRLYVIGEDIADPYGGAFRATRGLSTRFPDRVVSTPISEAGILGVAGGLALCGDRVIAEIMFGDFAALGFDQVLNFATKSVSMYGRRTPMSLVLRCPVGGGRGYGPTHSQSPQKHFVGVPHLWLYELSAFHDAGAVLRRALDRGEPAILFEPKTLYGDRIHRDGRVDDVFAYERVDPVGEWVRCFAPSAAGPRDAVVLTSGGMAGRALAAARAAVAGGRRVEVLVTARLYPLDLDPVVDSVLDAEQVVVAEESTAGGTWGAEVAKHLYERGWHRLRRPVTVLHSHDSVIPAAPHLERAVLLQADGILAALDDATAAVVRPPDPTAVPVAPTTVPVAPTTVPVASAAAEGSAEVRVPMLNSNDAQYLLIGWLVGDGVAVTAGEAIAEVETSKAVEDITAPVSGVLRHLVPAGEECRADEVIGRLGAPTAPTAPIAPIAPVPDRQGGAAVDGSPADPERREPRREAPEEFTSVPTAFVAVRVCLDAALGLVGDPARPGAPAVAGDGLLQLAVKAVATLREKFAMCFAALVGGDTVRIADGARVLVTVDVAGEQVVTVVTDAQSLTCEEITSGLTGPPVPTGANIALSWRHEPDVVLLQPVVPAGLACAVAIAGPDHELRVTDSGELVASAVAVLGMAHDHRLVNGREAAAFLAEVKTMLEDPARLAELAGV